MSTKPKAKPPFSSLPIHKDPSAPAFNAWGLFPLTSDASSQSNNNNNDEPSNNSNSNQSATADQLGMLNLLTPSTVASAAASSIRDGTRVSIDWPLTAMKPPCFKRQTTKHEIIAKEGVPVHDDVLTFNTQASSQWDGFRHFGVSVTDGDGEKKDVWYGGRGREELKGSDVIGIDAWVKNGGIVGRGILLDFASYADSTNHPLTPFSTTSIPTTLLEKVAIHQGLNPATCFQPGDILLLRTGWIRSYNALPSPQREELAKVFPVKAAGIESSEATLRWLWDNDFAAVAGDQPTLEAWPCQDREHFLHEWLLAGWGMPIGELFDLERLSEVCREKRRWTFFFSSMPLHVPGGVGSPPNGVCIF